MDFQVKLANPRGMCAGVERAVSIVERALELFGAPVYVRHEIVHNRHVVERLQEQGTIFVDEVHQVPSGSILVLSAHGVPPRVHQQAQRRALRVFDATCPLVTKVHMEVARYARAGRSCVLIGHAGHPEVEGTMAQYHHTQGAIYLVENLSQARRLKVHRPEGLAYVTQTTLSLHDTARIVEVLRERFPQLEGPRRDDICYATQNRQNAVLQLARECDLVLVVGSANSSNSNRLQELAQRQGIPAFLVEGPEALQPAWLEGKKIVGVTAGASAPEMLVQKIVARLGEYGAAPQVEELTGVLEKVFFPLPRELRLDPVDSNA